MSLAFHFLPDSRTVKMDTGMNSPMRNAIIHEVETAVSNTKQDLLNSMAVLIDSRLNTFQSNIQQSQKDISDFQMSKIEESVTDNFRFQRKETKMSTNSVLKFCLN